MYFLRHLLWVDCTAAALAGVTVLVLSGWLSRLHALPQELLLLTGAVNLLYGVYSFSLAVRSERPLALIQLLAVANLSWAVVCIGLAVVYWQQATVFRLVHLIGEAIFVGGLGLLEWRQRYQLLTTVSARPTP